MGLPTDNFCLSEHAPVLPPVPLPDVRPPPRFCPTVSTGGFENFPPKFQPESTVH